MGYCYVETLDGMAELQPDMVQVRLPPDLIWNPAAERVFGRF